MSGVFGPILTGNDVEQAAIATLKTWLPTYLAEMERRTDRAHGVLAPVKTWSIVNSFPPYRVDALPACHVISPGIARDPEKSGAGAVSAWFRIAVAVVCSASNQETTNEVAKLYGAAIRTLLVQKPSLGGLCKRLELVGETYDGVPADYLPVGAAVQVEADVFVPAISDASQGPAAPDVTPDGPGDWPTVEEVEIEVDQVEEITV